MGVDASPASRLSDRVTAARDGDPQPSASRRLLAFFLVFTSALLGAYMAFRPLNMAMPNADDWQTVLGEAASLGFVVGDDIVFTGGPLSSLYTGYADEHLFWLKLGLRFLLMITLAWSIVSIATANRRPVAGVLFGLGLAVCSFPNDMLLMSLPLLTALIAISKVDQPLDLPVFYLGILSTAAVTLAKFTAAPFAVVAFLLVDLLRLSYRRFPVYLVTYAAATFLLFSVVARSTSFLSYLTGSFSVAAGYTEAMFSNGWPLEFGSFLALAAVLIGAILYSEWRAFRAGVLPLPVALARVAVLSAYIFIAWKEGFVRHDSHSLTGWTGLGIGALTYASHRSSHRRRGMARLTVRRRPWRDSRILRALPYRARLSRPLHGMGRCHSCRTLRQGRSVADCRNEGVLQQSPRLAGAGAQIQARGLRVCASATTAAPPDRQRRQYSVDPDEHHRQWTALSAASVLSGIWDLYRDAHRVEPPQHRRARTGLSSVQDEPDRRTPSGHDGRRSLA